MEWKGDDIDEADVVEPEEGGDEAVAKVKKLKDEIATLRKEKQEYMDGWQRAKADYVNLLKRFEIETKSAKQGGTVKAVEALLPAFDALERAKEHGEIPDGFTFIVKQLESAFASFGLSQLGAVGESFNPLYHEAFGQDPVTDEKQDDTVTAILEKGWKISSNGLGTGGDPSTGSKSSPQAGSGQETIIRPAKVRVGQFASEK